MLTNRDWDLKLDEDVIRENATRYVEEQREVRARAGLESDDSCYEQISEVMVKATIEGLEDSASWHGLEEHTLIDETFSNLDLPSREALLLLLETMSQNGGASVEDVFAMKALLRIPETTRAGSIKTSTEEENRLAKIAEAKHIRGGSYGECAFSDLDSKFVKIGTEEDEYAVQLIDADPRLDEDDEISPMSFDTPWRAIPLSVINVGNVRKEQLAMSEVLGAMKDPEGEGEKLGELDLTSLAKVIKSQDEVEDNERGKQNLGGSGGTTDTEGDIAGDAESDRQAERTKRRDEKVKGRPVVRRVGV